MKIDKLLEEIEQQELIRKLIENGFGDIVDAFLENEDKVTTKKGRINKSGFCRVLDCKPKQLEDALQNMRELLKDDFPDEAAKFDL